MSLWSAEIHYRFFFAAERLFFSCPRGTMSRTMHPWSRSVWEQEKSAASRRPEKKESRSAAKPKR
jgi:hypothetical protein